MKLLKRVYKFLRKHNLKPNFKYHKGLIITPKSNNNIVARERFGDFVYVIEDFTFLDIYRVKYKKLVEAVEYFMEINNVNFNPLSSSQFIKYLSTLIDFISLYKRKIDIDEINLANLKYELIQKYITKRNVKKMYAKLFLHLTEKEGLNEEQAENKLYALNEEKYGFTNVAYLLNKLAKMLNPKEKERDLKLLNAEIYQNFEKLKFENPLDKAGNMFEDYARYHFREIKKNLMEKYGATRCIILNVDTDKKVVSILKNYKDLNRPDFSYLDNKLNMVGIDTTISLRGKNLKRKNQQISSDTIKKIVKVLKLKENITALGR